MLQLECQQGKCLWCMTVIWWTKKLPLSISGSGELKVIQDINFSYFKQEKSNPYWLFQNSILLAYWACAEQGTRKRLADDGHIFPPCLRCLSLAFITDSIIISNWKRNNICLWNTNAPRNSHFFENCGLDIRKLTLTDDLKLSTLGKKKWTDKETRGLRWPWIFEMTIANLFCCFQRWIYKNFYMFVQCK